MYNQKHTIYTVDNKVYINYPLNYTEDQVQTLISELKSLFYIKDTNAFDLVKFEKIQLDTEDIGISLLFFFKELMESIHFKNSEIELYFQSKVYDTIIKNFSKIDEAFNTSRIKKVTNE